jgi:hypothetical protein
VDRNKALSRFGWFEALHLSFTSSKRLMRIFDSIGGAQSLLMQTRVANFAKRRSVGSQFVGDDNHRNEALPSKQFSQQPQRRGLIALGLDSFAVDSAPHVHLPSSDWNQHFIEMPTAGAAFIDEKVQSINRGAFHRSAFALNAFTHLGFVDLAAQLSDDHLFGGFGPACGNTNSTGDYSISFTVPGYTLNEDWGRDEVYAYVTFGLPSSPRIRSNTVTGSYWSPAARPSQVFEAFFDGCCRRAPKGPWGTEKRETADNLLDRVENGAIGL